METRGNKAYSRFGSTSTSCIGAEMPRLSTPIGGHAGAGGGAFLGAGNTRRLTAHRGWNCGVRRLSTGNISGKASCRYETALRTSVNDAVPTVTEPDSGAGTGVLGDIHRPIGHTTTVMTSKIIACVAVGTDSGILDVLDSEQKLLCQNQVRVLTYINTCLINTTAT